MIRIAFDMDDELFEEFTDYQKRENLKGNAPTVYKLVADRLKELKQKESLQENHTPAVAG